MPKPLIEDKLWAVIEPLLPKRRWRKRYPGRKRISDRHTLTGMLFVPKSGIPWKMLPQEMACGSGMSCWRRLKAWQRARVWDRAHQVLLSKMREAERNRLPSCGQQASPPHGRVPRSVVLTEANRHDVTQLMPLLEAIPPIAGQRGAPKRKPALIRADRTYDSDPSRALWLSVLLIPKSLSATPSMETAWARPPGWWSARRGAD